MRLKNKKTGEIGYPYFQNWKEITCVIVDENAIQIAEYTSLAKLNEEWEDDEEPEIYWYIDTYNGQVDCINKSKGDYVDREIGNYFKTREEAERAVEKLKAWKRLKDEEFTISGWSHTPDMNLTTGSFITIKGFMPRVVKNMKDLDLLFGGEDD